MTPSDARQLLTGYCGNNNDNKRFGQTLSISLAIKGETTDRSDVQSTFQTVIQDLDPARNPQSDHHMRELITDRHGKGPATTKSNESGEAIDGIWGTAGISIKAGGYLPFNQCVRSDHRAIWVKISYQVAFGTLAPPSRKIGVRRLRLNDEISMKKFSEVLGKWYDRKDIPTRAQQLFDRISMVGYELTEADAAIFDQLVKDRHTGRMLADEACRRLHPGQPLPQPRQLEVGKTVGDGADQKALEHRLGHVGIPELPAQIGEGRGSNGASADAG